MALTAGTGHADGTRVGVSAGLLPGGKLAAAQDGHVASVSLGLATAVIGRVGHDVSSRIHLGGEAMLVFPLDDGDAGGEPPVHVFGLCGRVDAHRPLSRTVSLYAHGRLGYSQLIVEGTVARGVMTGGGLGSRFALTADLDGFVELGYLWAAHRAEAAGPDPQVYVSYVMLTGGVSLEL